MHIFLFWKNFSLNRASKGSLWLHQVAETRVSLRIYARHTGCPQMHLSALLSRLALQKGSQIQERIIYQGTREQDAGSDQDM